MNLTFELSLLNNCVLRIEDTTHRTREYLPEDSFIYAREKRFKYSDTYTVNIIKYKSVEDEEVLDVIFSQHSADLDEAYYRLKKDGHYIIDHLIVPSVECCQRLIQEEVLNEYDLRYATDGIKFYKCDLEGNLNECPFEEIYYLNPNADSTISKVSQDTFSICYLNNCYLNLCNQEFNKLIKNRCQTQQNKNFEIDLIWMAINAIKYNVEFGEDYLDLAQAILEDITRCSTVCSPIISKPHGCNCCN